MRTSWDPLAAEALIEVEHELGDANDARSSPFCASADPRIAAKDVEELWCGECREVFNRPAVIFIVIGDVEEFDDSNCMRRSAQDVLDLRRIGQGMQVDRCRSVPGGHRGMERYVSCGLSAGTMRRWSAHPLGR